ncbi:uncharacterized protein L201_004482 [Kwoniella dendrophila CBS 6074]|uniref:Uncharacterized protein n=1 Tax=Kwoniella dendrophila CBS 6074 TaxID=1295534 RepID=A0AAX4JXH1_9TREE
MTHSTSKLPPPAVFLYKETLHAISLPPLASWLIGLRKPEHLIRLNDLLERYKTPQSYHRIDVRLVESSELPPGTPDSPHNPLLEEGNNSKTEGDGREREVSKDREFIELEEGTTLNTYWDHKNGVQPSNTLLEEQQQQQHINDDNTLAQQEEEDGEEIVVQRDVEQSKPLQTPELQHNEVTTNKESSIIPSPSQTELALKPIQIPPLPSVLPPSILTGDIEKSPPTPKYPLPPTGPKRKVRELRLDLRTLDAAALFALETWRREELGLEKLEMDVPDSVWYKDATPTPEPEPVPSSPPSPSTRLTSIPKRRGRPPKKQVNTRMNDPIIIDTNEAEDTGLGLHINVDGESNNISGENQGLLHSSKSSNDEYPLEGIDKTSSIQVANILDSLGELAQKSLAVDVENEQPTLHGPTSGNDIMEQSKSVDIATDDKQVIINADTQVETGPSQVSVSATTAQTSPPPPEEITRTPSPHILLNDIFNEKEDDDPDFVPPPSPSRRRNTRSSRKRKSDSNVVVGVQMGFSEYQHAMRSDSENLKIGQTDIAFTSQVGEANTNKRTTLKSNDVEIIDSSPATQHIASQPAKMVPLDEQAEPALKVISHESEKSRPNNQSKKRNRPSWSTQTIQSDEIDELEDTPPPAPTQLPAKKVRKLNTSTPKKQTKSRSRSRVKFAIEIPTRKAELVTNNDNDDDDDEEEEEWGFLKSFG